MIKTLMKTNMHLRWFLFRLFEWLVSQSTGQTNRTLGGRELADLVPPPKYFWVCLTAAEGSFWVHSGTNFQI